jgi:hypothetical protein
MLICPGPSPVTQRRRSDREGNSLAGDSNHQDVHRRLAEVPLGSVHHGHTGRIRRHQVKQKLPKCLVAEGKSGKEALETPVCRVGLNLRLPR